VNHPKVITVLAVVGCVGATVGTEGAALAVCAPAAGFASGARILNRIQCDGFGNSFYENVFDASFTALTLGYGSMYEQGVEATLSPGALKAWALFHGTLPDIVGGGLDVAAPAGSSSSSG
jgi:hypothetical protein